MEINLSWGFAENLLENTDGVLHQCSLGAAACYLLFMLPCAISMTSSHSEGGNPEKVLFYGQSSGGNHALWIPVMTPFKGLVTAVAAHSACAQPVNHFIVFTENLLENTDGMGVLRPRQCSLGTAACYLLVMLTAALLMTSSHSEGRSSTQTVECRQA